VKGRGVATPKGTGDLSVSVEVAVPAKLSDEERAAIEAMAAAATESPRQHLFTS
jgi:molecular chaperone DnaJ